MEYVTQCVVGPPRLISLGSWEAVLHSGKKLPSLRDRAKKQAFTTGWQMEKKITKDTNGNNNTYPRGLSWGLKEMCSTWNTIDL